MVEAAYINRRKASESEQSFDSLRREAIELIQQVSGQVWTDYNLHDPGITILEQLIYAISDLKFRCEFAVEDYLCGDDGEINLAAQSLYPAAEIFSCRPTTAADYRKLFLNALPEIDNVWLTEMSDPDGVLGLYKLSLKLERDITQQKRDGIRDQIRQIYRGMRNLSEDLAEICVVENLEYELCAQIEVSSAVNPADILAEIYFACSRRIASSALITNYDQINTSTTGLDQLFDGPYTDRGFFLDEDGNMQKQKFSISELFSIINAVDGVDQIQQLYLHRNGQDYYDLIDPAGEDQALDLAVPSTAEEIKVVLTSHGRVLPIAIDDVIARYTEIRFKYYASRSTPQKLSLLYQPIRGNVRSINQYFSIQNQFPVNYGVNRYGIPASAGAEVKGRVRQLKAYLLIFEQFLVNFLGNLDSVDVLFSAQTEARESYTSKVLDKQQVHDLEAVYPAQAEQVMRRISAKYDNFNERKSRLLDYLLALYGERFSQNSLRHFNYYYGKDEVDAVIVANKVAYLKAIVELGRDRAAAPDYHSELNNQSSGLALRAAMLLGFQQPSAGSLTQMLVQQGIQLSPHQEYLQQMVDSEALRLIEINNIETSDYSAATLIAIEPEQTLAEIRSQLGEIVPLKNGLFSQTLFREGIDIARYRIGRNSKTEGYQLCFELDTNYFWQLGYFPDRASADRAASYFREFLLRLNRNSEGLHIVEHLLLRPAQSNAQLSPVDFYSFRISAILPDWSKRCHDLEFKNLVRETLRLNTPAHIFVEFYWLDFNRMREFEQLYQHWQMLKREPDSDIAELDRSAAAVIDFLLAEQQIQSSEMRLEI